MAFVRLAALSQLNEGLAIQVETQDGAVAICNVEGALYAIDGICPHSGGPLGDGALHGRILVCPFHGWAFDCVTGLSDAGDDLRQATYPVCTENGEIFVNLP
ncbi:MAG TPA: Rieske 2Fe-2S domain-containing protein [Bryobacteraceae bacterium]|nr:Rieske 2Fe-2S domain-containing protein [Bryobacteraceae bacterium]